MLIEGAPEKEPWKRYYLGRYISAKLSIAQHVKLDGVGPVDNRPSTD